MELSRRFAPADGYLCDMSGQSVLCQRGNSGGQRFQRNGGDADAGVGVFLQDDVHNLRHPALGAADKNAVRRGQLP